MKLDSYSVYLRQVHDGDLPLIMAWRNIEKVFAGFYEQNSPLKWQEHINWWKSRHDREDWVVMIEEDGVQRGVGVVNVSGLGTKLPSVGIYIGEVTLWGKKIGSKAVELAVKWLSKKGYKGGQANIMKDNIASIKMFESLGFKWIGEGREGEWLYRLAMEEEDGT